MKDFESVKEHTINSLESTLAIEGDLIREELDKLIGDNYDYILAKAFSCCSFCKEHPRISPSLKLKCEEFLNNFNYYSRMKYT